MSTNLKQDLQGIQENVLLADYTTLKIGGPAKLFVEVTNETELKDAIQKANGNMIPYFILAGGSDVLISDSGFDGLVILFRIKGIKAKGQNLLVKSGTKLQDLIDTANKHGLGGIEKLTDIPGSVGGAVYGNAGAYGKTISDHIRRVQVFNGTKVFWMSKEDCNFQYRESIFKKNKKLTILEIEFELQKQSSKDLQKVSREIRKIRRQKYNDGLKSPGSFFKNIIADNLSPEILERIPKDKINYGKISTGYLLEAVGAKGKKLDGVEVASYHGNLFLNRGSGTAKAFFTLAKKYKDKVKEKFGIDLEPEVQLIGFKKQL
ncbi:UDP-N-acetylenolpyruvoylglucosamine reductase [Candidatus Woesebacteria bacterium]|nr:UDP-N-acetylenolpyruvoylglucosamine reductase [Candidatus Woesebacteria bacterium]|tara:strand:- start:941 stop:1897 length:957 start_codon:yes stop_codon:yes gene_type:complete